MQQQFLDAIEEGDVKRVRELIATGADVNLPDGKAHGRTPLMTASLSPDMVRELIAAGANVNGTNGRETPLHVAAATNSVEEIKLLIQAGADIEAGAAKGQSALDDALYCGRATDGVRALVEAGAKLTPQRLACGILGAADQLNHRLVEFLLDHGADPNTRDSQGCPVLILVARYSGSYETVRRLLAAGADPQATFQGKTALRWSQDGPMCEKRVVTLLREAMADLKATEILSQWDQSDFPALDNGYTYPVDVRLHAFADRDRWALVIEVLGVNDHYGFGHEQIHVASYVYGNCLDAGPGMVPAVMQPTSDGPEGLTFDADGVRLEATHVRIRKTVVPISRDPQFYASKGIKVTKREALRVHELVRGLVPEHRDLLLATEDELRRVVPADLPEVLRLEEWRHPDIAGGKKASESRTFQSLATVLATGDASQYRPDPKPNTHWKHWRMGGVL
jgi:hypothetical protein